MENGSFIKIMVELEDASFPAIERGVDIYIYHQGRDRPHIRVGRCGFLRRPKKIKGDPIH